MRHVLWIGGPPASGKTTVATRLARRHGLRLYNADARTWEHRDRAVRRAIPAAIRWEALTPEERWVTSTPEEMLEQSLHRERGPMVVEDLQALPRSPLVVAEGSTLPPTAVRDRSRAVWLIATPEFQRNRLEERDLPQGPRTLFLLLAAEIERDARAADVPIIVVDGASGVDTTLTAVERHFEGALAEGPLAASLAERRALLREANEAAVAQLRAYFGRPWTEGDAGEAERRYLCECGERECDAGVDARVDVAAKGPVLAPGHG